MGSGVKEVISRPPRSPIRAFLLQSAIRHLRFLVFGLALPLAGADLAPLPFAGAFPPGATPGLAACSLTLGDPGAGAAGAFKLLSSSGFAGTGTGVMVGSAS